MPNRALPRLRSAHFRVQLTSAAETSFSINSRSSSEISAPRSTNLGRMIEKIEGTSVIADSQCVIISNASSIAISAENRRSDIHTHGMTDLRFSAEMAMLLALLMITHWLSAITLVPSIFAIIRPKFVERGAEISDEDLELIEKDVSAA